MKVSNHIAGGVDAGINTSGDRFGGGESKSETEMVDQAKIIGELSLSTPSPYSSAWEEVFPSVDSSVEVRDTSSEIPFAGNSFVGEPYQISNEEFEMMVNGDPSLGIEPLNKEQLTALKEHIVNGRIIVLPNEGSNDSNPPQKVLKKVR